MNGERKENFNFNYADKYLVPINESAFTKILTKLKSNQPSHKVSFWLAICLL